MDIKTKEQRSENMRQIRNKNTKIEIILRKALWHAGYRYRKNYKKLPGTPDIALTRYKIAVFCDSEFFHGKDWDNLNERLSRSENSEFWINKIQKNITHDKEVTKELRALGWTVLRFWGKDITKNTQGCVDIISEMVFNNSIE